MNRDMLCEKCGIRKKQSNGISYAKRNYGSKRYKKHCTVCTKYPTLGDILKITFCRICKTTYHPSQIDVDHLDSNHSNDNPENIQIICSNCHRLKTYMCKDTVKDSK